MHAICQLYYTQEIGFNYDKMQYANRYTSLDYLHTSLPIAVRTLIEMVHSLAMPTDPLPIPMILTYTVNVGPSLNPQSHLKLLRPVRVNYGFEL